MTRAPEAPRIATLAWLGVLVVLTPSPAASQSEEWLGPPARTVVMVADRGGRTLAEGSSPEFPGSDGLLQLCEGARYTQIATELIDAWKNGRTIWNGLLSESSAALARDDLECILPGLQSEDPRVRWATMELVNAIGSPSSADAVLAFLKKENPRSQAAFLARVLLWGTLQDHRAVPSLLEALEHPEQWDDLVNISRGPPDRRLCAPLLKALESTPIHSEQRGRALLRAFAKNGPTCPQSSEIVQAVRRLTPSRWIEFSLPDLARSLCPLTGCPWMAKALIEIYQQRGCPGDYRILDQYDEAMGPGGMMPVYSHFLRTGSEPCARSMAHRILVQAIKGCEPSDLRCYLRGFETLPLEVRRKVTSTGMGLAGLSRLATSPGGQLLDEYRALFHGNERVMSDLAGWVADSCGPRSLGYEPAKLVAALNVALSAGPAFSSEAHRQALRRELLEARWRLMNSQIPRHVSVEVLQTSTSGRWSLLVRGPPAELEAIRKAPAHLLVKGKEDRIATTAAFVAEEPGAVSGEAGHTLTIRSEIPQSGTSISGKPIRLMFLGSSPSAFRGSLPVPRGGVGPD